MQTCTQEPLVGWCNAYISLPCCVFDPFLLQGRVFSSKRVCHVSSNHWSKGRWRGRAGAVHSQAIQWSKLHVSYVRKAATLGDPCRSVLNTLNALERNCNAFISTSPHSSELLHAASYPNPSLYAMWLIETSHSFWHWNMHSTLDFFSLE